jgi:hypothetical protein
MSSQVYAPVNYTPMQPDESGYVDAVNSVRRDRMARAGGMQALEAMLLANQQGKANLDRYTAQTPHEISKSRREGTYADLEVNTPGHLPALLAGQRANAGKQVLEHRFIEQTQPGKINQTNAEQDLSAFSTQLQRIQALGRAAGPLMAQGEYQRLFQNAPEEMKKFLPSMYDAGSIEETLSLLAQTPQHRGAMALEKERGATARAVGAGNNAATVAAANARAASRVKTLLQQFESAKTLEQMVMYGEMILTDDSVDEPTKRQVAVGVDRAKRMFAEKMARGGLDLGNPRGGAGGIAAGVNSRLGPTGGGMGPGAGGSGITPPAGSNILRFDAQGNPIR